MADQPQPEKKRAKRHQVVLDPELARMVGVIASALDMTVPDWVNNTLHPIAVRELPRAMEQMGYEAKPKPKK